jgi:6-phosphogluconolactonase
MRKTMGVALGTLVFGLVALLPAQAQSTRDSGAVFVMTNAAENNEILSFARMADGSLFDRHVFATGGRGSGGTIDPLQSQGSLLLSEDRSLLFATNAGSGDITVFRVNGPRLERIQVEPSGGSSPVAITQHGELIYVLNVGGNDSVAGFRLSGNGKIEQIAGSRKQLSNSDTGASGLVISPDGHFLAVTERLNGLVDVFAIGSDGTLGGIVSTASSGPGPFSIGFAPNGALLTTEAPNSAISSYAVQSSGALTVVSGSIATQGTAACWHVITPDGRFVYTSNSGTSSISGFAIANNGGLAPIGVTVLATQAAGSTNLDIAITADGRYLYLLNARTGTVGVFAIHQDGTLLGLGTAGDVPAAAGANGITAF